MDLARIQPSFWLYWLTFCGIIMAGYFGTAATTYGLVSKSLNRNISRPEQQDQLKDKRSIASDIRLSVLAVIFFAFGAACFTICYRLGLTRAYMNCNVQELPYFILSYVAVLVLQDTYFYFTHRLFHLPQLFKLFHQGHHRSRPPTPWTFFALEPLEAAVQVSFLLLITFIIPLHLGVLIIILLTMVIWAMGNHLGFQIVPYSDSSRLWGKWCIGSAHHLVHHQRYSQHYGLYFTFWDKLLGTQDADYEEKRLQHSSSVSCAESHF